MMSQYETKKDEPVTRCWWVNQNKTYKAEVRGGYMWSPKMTRHGHFNQFYENMTLTRPGDLVFSLAGGLIKNIGTVSAMPRSASRPDDLGKESDARDRDGWLVMVDYEEQPNPIAPREHMDQLGPLLPAKFSPLLADGKGKRVYLAEISPELALTLQSLIGDAVNKKEREIQNRTDIRATHKLQLVRSRVGQGQYRQNLSRFEPGCRITDITDGRFLIASHIKPWSKSNDIEKLDGNNGLFLSPHIDHLFDRGYISFKDNGKLMIHPTLPVKVSDSLGLVPGTKTKPLSAEQSVYMKFHRKKVFGKRSF